MDRKLASAFAGMFKQPSKNAGPPRPVNLTPPSSITQGELALDLTQRMAEVTVVPAQRKGATGRLGSEEAKFCIRRYVFVSSLAVITINDHVN